MRPGFSLLELLIAVVLVIMAASIALFAVIGSSSVIERSDVRSQLAEATSDLAATLQAAADTASSADPAVITTMSYGVNYPDSDVNPTILKANRHCFSNSPANRCNDPNAGATPEGNLVEIRQFGEGHRQNVCFLIGLAEVLSDSDGLRVFFKSEQATAPDKVAVTVFKLNESGLCDYSTIYHRSVISGDKIKALNLASRMEKIGYKCQTGDCQAAKLRYYFLAQTTVALGRANQPGTRRPSIDYISTLNIGLR